VIKTVNGTPIRMKDLGTISQGPKIRLGRSAKRSIAPTAR